MIDDVIANNEVNKLETISFLKTLDNISALDTVDEILDSAANFLYRKTDSQYIYYIVRKQDDQYIEKAFPSNSFSFLTKENINLLIDKLNFNKFYNLKSAQINNLPSLLKEKLSSKNYQFNFFFIPLICSNNYKSGFIFLTEKSELISKLYESDLLIFLRFIEKTIQKLKLKKELIESISKAESALKSKNEFLRNMSHEIRTPLNSLIGFTELLEKRILDLDTKKYLESIKVSSHTLLNLINDILDLAKLDYGKIKLVQSPVQLDKLLFEIKQIFIHQVESKELRFLIEIDPSLPKVLSLDYIRLKQVLLNVIGNAVKFTDQGYIKVTIYNRYPELKSNTVDLVIAVEDSGIGIPENQKEKIFEAFEQQSDHVNKLGGTGIGLTITKKLVDLMRGSILIDSIPGKGTYFNIVLPGIEIAFTSNHENEDLDNLSNIIHKTEYVQLVAENKENLNLLKNILKLKQTNLLVSTNYTQIPDDVILIILYDDNVDFSNELFKNVNEAHVPFIFITNNKINGNLNLNNNNSVIIKPTEIHELKKTAYSLIQHYKQKKTDFSLVTNTELNEFYIKLKELENEWENINKTMIINDIELFYSKLKDISEHYKIKDFKIWLNHLELEIDNFNIKKAIDLFRQFPKWLHLIKDELKNRS